MNRWLSLAVVLLLGIVIGQQLQYRSSNEAPAADAITPPALGAGEATPTGSAAAGSAARPLQASTQPDAPVPLSATRYWISETVSDEKPYGYAALLALEPGGELIIERCEAPAYESIEELNAEEPPFLAPECRLATTGRIQGFLDGEIVYLDASANERRIGYELLGSGALAQLILELEDGPERLVAGQKNTIGEALGNLPSVKRAHDEAWREHARLRGETAGGS